MAKKKKQPRSAEPVKKAPAITADTRIGDVVFYVEEVAIKEEAALLAEHGTLLASGPRYALVGLLSVVAAGLGWLVLGLWTVAVVAVLTAILVWALRKNDTEKRSARAELLEQIATKRAEFEALHKTIETACRDLGIHCFGCDAAPRETFGEGARLHGFDLDTVLAGLNALQLDLSRLPTAGEAGSQRPH